jgi:hypothetical protein
MACHFKNYVLRDGDYETKFRDDMGKLLGAVDKYQARRVERSAKTAGRNQDCGGRVSVTLDQLQKLKPKRIIPIRIRASRAPATHYHGSPN